MQPHTILLHGTRASNRGLGNCNSLPCKCQAQRVLRQSPPCRHHGPHRHCRMLRSKRGTEFKRMLIAELPGSRHTIGTAGFFRRGTGTLSRVLHERSRVAYFDITITVLPDTDSEDQSYTFKTAKDRHVHRTVAKSLPDNTTGTLLTSKAVLTGRASTCTPLPI